MPDPKPEADLKPEAEPKPAAEPRLGAGRPPSAPAPPTAPAPAPPIAPAPATTAAPIASPPAGSAGGRSARQRVEQAPALALGPRLKQYLIYAGLGLAAMAAWPLAAWLLLGGEFLGTGEQALVFGGLTFFFLAPLSAAGVSEGVFSALLVAVWLLAALAPAAWLSRRVRERRTLLAVLAIQSGFALLQAVLGGGFVMLRGV